MAGAEKMMEGISGTLKTNIVILNVFGVIFSAATAGFSLWLYADIKALMSYHVFMITEAGESRNQVLAYLIYRSAALAAIAGALVYFGGRLSMSSFDQAMRFTKRRVGSKFLEHLFDHYEKNISSDVNLPQIMLSFEVWNKTVESAFSAPKPQNRKDDDEAMKTLLKFALPRVPSTGNAARTPRKKRHPSSETIA
jgi:hypothetical protein